MSLILVHHHYRPGGVRRVLELATPHLVRALPLSPRRVVLLGGEAPDALWLERFRARLGKTPVLCITDSALLYLTEIHASPTFITRRLRRILAAALASETPEGGVVWAHNQSLGRNLLLTRELIRTCETHHLKLVLHQHDWWFDNRWQRWTDLLRTGLRSLDALAPLFFPRSRPIRYAAINQTMAGPLTEAFAGQAAWLPNPVEPAPAPSPRRLREAQAWLHDQLGRHAPVWLVPCRLLRRKNLAEALLLTRWLRPEAWLVTTGTVSSAEEQAYAETLTAAAREHAWPLRLGVLGGDESTKPHVPELLAASEAILLTSLQEGFGLPYLEAALAQRPLLARHLPNVQPDLASLGFRFPQGYDEVRIDPRLFDWKQERRRQRARFAAWRERLPAPCQPLAEAPLWWAETRPTPVPFSRLTLTAQQEVLTRPVQESWNRCLPLNPHLKTWRERSRQGRLRVTPWPPAATRQLGGAAYARRFVRLLQAAPSRPDPNAALDVAALQRTFIRDTLRADNLYPLLWSPEP